MEGKKISIIMGVYNCERLLPEAIDSILNQTYQSWELIICDDCSTDNTYAVADEYAKKFPQKIILIKNDENKRLAFTLNHCLEYATGDYIARMDGDDMSCPKRLEKEISFLEEHPEYDLVSCAMQRFNEEGTIDVVRFPECPDQYSLRKGTCFCHAALLCKKTVYEKLKGYTVLNRTKRCEDCDLWFRFFYHDFKGYNLQEPLYLVREDSEAVARRTFRSRWENFGTTVYGYRLLNYPKHWIVIEFFRVLAKSLTPYKAVELYRKYQKKKYQKNTAT